MKEQQKLSRRCYKIIFFFLYFCLCLMSFFSFSVSSNLFFNLSVFITVIKFYITNKILKAIKLYFLFFFFTMRNIWIFKCWNILLKIGNANHPSKTKYSQHWVDHIPILTWKFSIQFLLNHSSHLCVNNRYCYRVSMSIYYCCLCIYYTCSA